MARDWTKTKAYRTLRDGLSDSLEARGLVEPVYQTLLAQYLELWCEFQTLTDDIKENGVSYVNMRTGERRENRSLTIRHQTAEKMVRIYQALGFRQLAEGSAAVQSFDDDEL